MKTEVFPNCGNSPKLAAVIDLSLSLISGDVEKIIALVREDFTYSAVGSDHSLNYTDVKSGMPIFSSPSKIVIESGLSHGNGAMCEGIIKLNNGKIVNFCFVATFVNTARDALIKKLHAYYVSTEKISS